MKAYPEIEYLKNLLEKHHIRIEQTGERNNISGLWVNVFIGSASWKIYIEDEYGDFNADQPLMGLFLVLHNLRHYKECEDFLVWCNLCGISASDSEMLSYYRNLDLVYNHIQKILGKIDPAISSFDYELRTGVVQALTKY